MRIEDLLINSAQRSPDKTAVIHGAARATYGEILAKAAGLASCIQASGLKTGDRVIIAMDNSIDYVIAYFGVHLSGCVTVSINQQTLTAGFSMIARDCSPAGLIAGIGFIRQIEGSGELDRLRFIAVTGRPEQIPTDINARIPGIVLFADCIKAGCDIKAHNGNSESLASIIYTSGTTSAPKGVMLAHRNLLANTGSIVEYLSINETDRIMVVLPFYYSYGNSLLLTHIAKGGAIVLDNRFVYPNVILNKMISECVTAFAGVPSTFAILCHRSNFKALQFPMLRYITQAGGPMSHALSVEILKVVPHVKLYIMYGQTEASARLSYLHPDDIHRKSDSIGKAIPGVALDVLNENGAPVKPGETGEIVASGDNIMMGYWGKPDETAKVLRDGKLFTGDLATVDDDGYLYIVGRKWDMIKSGAHRIAPREIEEILMEHPAVHEAAVIGKDDRILGESIFAFVALKDGQACTKEELLTHCRGKLQLFKIPKAICFLDSLPKTESMKIKKHELKKSELIKR
ncbi:MAG: AMP-binding protein [Deltaproteobacteria bacterium]|nr:AMP-binding protein [Deltaproteobacteria bacterium]